MHHSRYASGPGPLSQLNLSRAPVREALDPRLRKSGSGPHFLAPLRACRKPRPLTTHCPRSFVSSPHTPSRFRAGPLTSTCAYLGKPHPNLYPPVLSSNLRSLHPPGFGNPVPTIHAAFMRIHPSYPLFHPQRLLLREISILSLSFLEAFSPGAKLISHMPYSHHATPPAVRSTTQDAPGNSQPRPSHEPPRTP